MVDVFARHTFAELWEPRVMVGVLVAATLYFVLIGPLRRRYALGAPATTGQVAAFLAAAFAFYVAAGSPLHLIGELYLMSAHMISVLLLSMVVPPLLLVGVPGWAFQLLLRPRPLRIVLGALAKPVVGLALGNLVFAIWHVPGLFELALQDPVLHVLQYATIVATSVLAWWALLSPIPELPRIPKPVQLLYCFAWIVLQMILFGPFMASESAIYSIYEQAPRLIPGMTALGDQLAGHGIMNVVASAILTGFFASAFFRWAAEKSENSPNGEPSR